MKKLLIVYLIIGSVVLTYLYANVMINPGELSQGHQNLSNKCLSCHQPFQGISNNKCISCHKLSEIGKDTLFLVDTLKTNKVLFHESFINQDCIACHSDHKGKGPNLSLNKFEHSLLTNSVKNNCASCHKTPENELHKQISTDCKSCHSTNNWNTLVTFNHDLIEGVNKDNCISCHPSPTDTFHQSVKTNCNECHTTNKWLPSTFDHSEFFVLDKDHSPNKCSTCHVQNNFKKYTCYNCHEHSIENISRKHLKEGIRDFQDCVLCHKSADEHDIRMNNLPNSLRDKSERKHKKSGDKHHDDDD
ncbi:MAG: cytochrome c3 family protein [Lutibacter sp.]|jgi:predicted CXXCH cytochrome family protein